MTIDMPITVELSCKYDIIEPIYPIVPSNIPIGKSLLIIGPSRKGPLLKPIYVRTNQQANDFFGEDLAFPYYEAKSCGATHIFVMRIGELYNPEEGYQKPSRDDLFIYLQEAYELIIGFNIDYIYVVGAYFDDTEGISLDGEFITFSKDMNIKYSYARQLAELCHKKLTVGEYCHGIIGVKPITTDTNSWYENIINNSLTIGTDNSYDLSKKYIDYDNFDYGRYISVVVSSIRMTKPDGTYYITSGAGVYAGLLSSLSPKVSPTYKTLPVFDIYETLSDDQIDRLSISGFVVFKKSVRHGIVPYEAVTFANPNSDFYKFPNIRILNIASERIQSQITIGDRMIKNHELEIAHNVLSQMVSDQEIKSFTIDAEIISNTELNLLIEINPYTYTSSISTNIHINLS